MTTLLIVIVIGYILPLKIFLLMGTWELIKGYFKFGKRDMKDPDGILSFQILAGMGVVPVGNIVMLVLLAYTEYQEHQEKAK